MVYARNEKLSIGRKLFYGEMNLPSVAEKYGIRSATAVKYLKRYCTARHTEADAYAADVRESNRLGLMSMIGYEKLSR